MDTERQPNTLHDDAFTDALGVLEDAIDGFIACDSAFRIVFLNSAAAQLYCKVKPELLGTAPWEPASDWGGSELEIESRRAMAERVSATFESYYRVSGRWLVP